MRMPIDFSEAKLQELKAAAVEFGGQAKLGRAAGLSGIYVHDLIHGKRLNQTAHDKIYFALDGKWERRSGPQDRRGVLKLT